MTDSEKIEELTKAVTAMFFIVDYLLSESDNTGYDYLHARERLLNTRELVFKLNETSRD